MKYLLFFNGSIVKSSNYYKTILKTYNELIRNYSNIGNCISVVETATGKELLTNE